jgi:manganese transport protein
MGEGSVGKLPFAIFPLLRFTDDRALMGVFANGLLTKVVAWSLFLIISTANVWLVVQTFAG